MSHLRTTEVTTPKNYLHGVGNESLGLPQNISNVGQAINLLGANVIKSLMIYVQGFKSYEGSPNTKALLNDIRHQICNTKPLF